MHDFLETYGKIIIALIVIAALLGIAALVGPIVSKAITGAVTELGSTIPTH